MVGKMVEQPLKLVGSKSQEFIVDLNLKNK
jgi:hypothetical protein